MKMARYLVNTLHYLSDIIRGLDIKVAEETVISKRNSRSRYYKR